MLLIRPRRNRKSRAIRGMVQEVRLHTSDLIYPQFVIAGENQSSAIAAMPGISRLSVDLLLKEMEKIVALKIPAVALFPVIPKEKKDLEGREALNPKGLLQETIRAVKREFPSLCLISDVALDPYTLHGHDGIVDANGNVMNDESVEKLVEMALVQAQAGVDMVAPSDMMDGRVRAIREALDRNGFNHVSIHAYSAKYASSFYGPFRDAVHSHLSFGDKKNYQMNPANRREAVLEAMLDASEGADILMVKPALAYLDVIAEIRAATNLPISAYQVSGEYSMIQAAAERGWINGPAVFWESVTSIKRAGADMIFTYAAPLLAEMIRSGVHD